MSAAEPTRDLAWAKEHGREALEYAERIQWSAEIDRDALRLLLAAAEDAGRWRGLNIVPATLECVEQMERGPSQPVTIRSERNPDGTWTLMLTTHQCAARAAGAGEVAP